MADETPFQTVGPFFEFALVYPGANRLVNERTRGTRIVVSGAVLDGAGMPIPDALVEIWQADAGGRCHHPDDSRDAPAPDPEFNGFGRSATDAQGRFVFETIRPGRVPALDGRLQAPHILVSVLGRGLLTRLVTRMYFEDEASTLEDPILALVPAERRGTLIARGDGHGRYRFDIVVQGERETVFFDL